MVKYILGYYHYVDLLTLEGKLFQLIFSPLPNRIKKNIHNSML